MGDRTLLEVCGNPSGPLPSRGTPAWKGIDNALSKALKEVGARGRFYSWAALWRTLYGSSPPPRSDFHSLLSTLTVSDLVSRLATRRTPGMRDFLSWNVRWLKDERSRNIQAKKAAIYGALLTGSLVPLQETHWDAQSKEIWRNLFPSCTVVAAPAIPGAAAGDRPAGGVAVVLPAEYILLDEQILAPGRALLCD